ncbi:hypothetical protein A4U94_14495 [Prescottella equi]|uniref:Panacea domain-containing protein n=1 Tax=Rhodococcus hoagii TaxID=43767 RepID=UPI0009BDA4A6|nr:type II toxin-antitoxin system antitoxin SocA domain-containing protein [Prescottella equi]OQQ21540.1 hypothetical protein A4U94_14495 [Prescottella equi]
MLTPVPPDVSYDLDVSQVARFLIALDSERPEPDVTQLKLQKLLYLVQANYLAATGRRLFHADVEAFDHGPVVFSVLKEYEPYSRSVIAPDSTSWDSELLPPDAQNFISAVWQHYKDFSASALWKLTHSQRPWNECYTPGAYRKKISDEVMTEYFRHEVPLEERALHPNVVVVDRGFLDDLDDDEDEIVARAISALR